MSVYGLSNIAPVHFILHKAMLISILHPHSLLYFDTTLILPPIPTHAHKYTQTLNKVTSDIIDAKTTHATGEVNTPKNRYQDKIPCKAVL